MPSCAEGGVLGILPGLIGVIQATETIKLILGIGEPLIGRLLLFDALAMSFRELKLRKNPECPVCGPHPTVTELIDYEQFCGIEPPTSVGPLEVAREKRRRSPVVDGIPSHGGRAEAQNGREGRHFVLDVASRTNTTSRTWARRNPLGEVETPGRRTCRAKGPRDHRPLPLRRSQPEGRSHAEERRDSPMSPTSQAAS